MVKKSPNIHPSIHPSTPGSILTAAQRMTMPVPFSTHPIVAFPCQIVHYSDQNLKICHSIQDQPSSNPHSTWYFGPHQRLLRVRCIRTSSQQSRAYSHQYGSKERRYATCIRMLREVSTSYKLNVCSRPNYLDPLFFLSSDGFTYYLKSTHSTLSREEKPSICK